MHASRLAALLCAAILTLPLGAQQAHDAEYTAKIRELTPTHPTWKFTTELVDHLPASATVPSPLKVLGYVPGTPGRLSYVADVNRYFRALDEASPRVTVVSLGMSDEGREMLLAMIADEATLARADEYRTMLGRLADPRGLAPDEKTRLLAQAKPIYWLTGSIHSPEIGSPEMLMEFAYRLAVDESEFVRKIRSGVITLITPITEVDGRDRMVDVNKLSRSLKLGPQGVSLIYWGKYTAHDNNRDGMVLSQKLTQNVMKGFLQWKPVVFHDLHESVPFLYVSTGTGPYNDEFDPIVIDEWHTLAYQEITELTRRGLPGVWTHGFYDGWAPNYMLAIANLHNSIGRFYETYTSTGTDCQTVKLQASATERRWDRPNPPVNGVKWCMRSNINYQQSGVMIALKYVADNAATFLTNYAAKAERMVKKGQTTAPYAYVIPRDQRRAAEAADLVNLFRAHGTEVHVAQEDFEIKPSGKAATADSARRDTAAKPVTPDPRPLTRVHKGDWIVRLDQPYTQTVRTLLAVQKYKPDDPSPYDDTGWTLDELRHVVTHKVADSAILAKPMQMLTADARVEGSVSGSGNVILVEHLGDWRSAVLPWKVGNARVSAAEVAFDAAGRSWPAGTFIVTDARGGRGRAAVHELGLTGIAVGNAPAARAHEVRPPRVALIHSWLETQNEGWVRYALDQLGVPYTYISDQSLATRGRLEAFDVLVFPHVSGSVQSLINGRPKTGPPIPWRKTALTPNLDKWDTTDDIRRGMGLDGAAALRAFVDRGGVLITTGNTSRLPLTLGFNPSVSEEEARNLRTRGAIFRARADTTGSPILYGYERKIFPVYFNRTPVLEVQGRDTSGRLDAVDPAIVADIDRQRGRVILSFHNKADSLLVSGLLVSGSEMAGKAAVVDAPVGRGRVVLFGIRPMWRWQTQGTFAMVLNAMANWEHLGVTTMPEKPTVAEAQEARQR